LDETSMRVGSIATLLGAALPVSEIVRIS
jgi:hypothetical protein